MKKNIIIVSLAVVIVGLIGYVVLSQRNTSPAGTTNQTTNSTSNTKGTANQSDQQKAADQAGKQISGGHCTGTDKPKLTHLPMDPADFAFILPYGLMVGGHVTPVDHQYFSPIIFDSPPSTYNVYAMADSQLVGVQTRTHQGQGQNKSIMVTDYHLIFSVSCRLFYYYDLVNSLATGLEDAFNDMNNHNGVHVTSGQLIGKIGGQTLDFAVWDTEKPLTGFIVPEHYARESWKIYTADPLDYYADDIKAAALAKYVRTAEPLSGKIDYDIDGKLIGTWFKQEANGTTTGYAGTGENDYWTTHLSFSPYFLDPSGFLISIGNWPKPDGASQFASKEDGPNPADVDVSTGLVKYNLVRFDDYKANGQRWDNMTFPNSPISLHKLSSVEGCMLAQMTDTRTLKAEAFNGKNCSLVTGFTSAATIYIR